MGQLKPGTTYIYEHADGVTYAREIGAPVNSRFEIGRSPGRHDQDDQELWSKIRLAGKNDPDLQQMIDQIKIYYKLKQ